MPALGLGLRLKDMKRSGGNKREIDCKTVRFFFLKKIGLEEINSSLRVLRARATHARRACEAREIIFFGVSSQSRSPFSAFV